MSQPEWDALVEEVRDLRTRVARMEMAMGMSADAAPPRRRPLRRACRGIAAGAGNPGLPHLAPAGSRTGAARPGRRLPAARAHRSGHLLAQDGCRHRAGLRHAVAGLGGAHSGRAPPGNRAARADERAGALPAALRGHRALPRHLHLDGGGASAGVHPLRPRRLLAQGPADCGHLRHAGRARHQRRPAACPPRMSCRSPSCFWPSPWPWKSPPA